jgi:hypothetical protein
MTTKQNWNYVLLWVVRFLSNLRNPRLSNLVVFRKLRSFFRVNERCILFAQLFHVRYGDNLLVEEMQD